MKRIFLLAAATIMQLSVFAAAGINLSDAVAKKMVSMVGVTTAGKYTGKSLRLKITNTGKSAIAINVNTGVILSPADPAYQQLILPGGEHLSLKANETGEVDVQVFCNNAVKNCPAEGIRYTYYRTCGENTMKVLAYVKDHGFFDHLGQAAVWSMTNYLALNCVYDPERPEESEKLINHIVAITRRPKPAYYTTYADYEQPGQRAYIGKAGTIYVPFDITLTAAKPVTFAVYTTSNSFVKRISDPQMVMAGTHRVVAEITPADFETGKYAVRAMRGDQVLKEQVVFIEQPWITFKD